MLTFFALFLRFKIKNSKIGVAMAIASNPHSAAAALLNNNESYEAISPIKCAKAIFSPSIYWDYNKSVHFRLLQKTSGSVIEAQKVLLVVTQNVDKRAFLFFFLLFST